MLQQKNLPEHFLLTLDQLTCVSDHGKSLDILMFQKPETCRNRQNKITG